MLLRYQRHFSDSTVCAPRGFGRPAKLNSALSPSSRPSAGKIGAMDGAMMGLAGTVVGAAVMGGVGIAKSMADSWLPGVAANSDLKRHNQAELQSVRREAVKEWRAGLADARDAYRQWAAGPRDGDAPNVVGDQWFEALRPYLPTTGEAAKYRSAHEVHCDNPTVALLSLEIGRIESEWVTTAGLCPRCRRTSPG